MSQGSILGSLKFVVDIGSLKFVLYSEDLSAVTEQHHVDHDIYVDNRKLSDQPSISCIADLITNIENSIGSTNGMPPSTFSSTQ